MALAAAGLVFTWGRRGPHLGRGHSFDFGVEGPGLVPELSSVRCGGVALVGWA